VLYEQSLAIERRLADLIRLIRAGGHSTPVLAKKLGVSIPTISRGITALRQRGYRIRPIRLPKQWAYELMSEPAAVSQA
jgi:biotin operon repressor